MKNWINDTQFAISLDVAEPVRLQLLGVPTPAQTIFGYSTYIERADGTRVPSGYLQCNWLWENMSRESLYTLLRVLNISDDGDSFAYVKMITDTRNGKQATPQWTTFTGVLYTPNLSGGDGMSVPSSPYAYQSVRLFFNKLVEVI